MNDSQYYIIPTFLEKCITKTTELAENIWTKQWNPDTHTTINKYPSNKMSPLVFNLKLIEYAHKLHDIVYRMNLKDSMYTALLDQIIYGINL